MKYLVESGMRPQSFTAMFAEPPDCDLNMKAELRKRGSAMIRRMIVGAFWSDELRLPRGITSTRRSSAHRPRLHLLCCGRKGAVIFGIIDFT